MINAKKRTVICATVSQMATSPQWPGFFTPTVCRSILFIPAKIFPTKATYLQWPVNSGLGRQFSTDLHC